MAARSKHLDLSGSITHHDVDERFLLIKSIVDGVSLRQVGARRPLEFHNANELALVVLIGIGLHRACDRRRLDPELNNLHSLRRGNQTLFNDLNVAVLVVFDHSRLHGQGVAARSQTGQLKHHGRFVGLNDGHQVVHAGELVINRPSLRERRAALPRQLNETFLGIQLLRGGDGTLLIPQVHNLHGLGGGNETNLNALCAVLGHVQLRRGNAVHVAAGFNALERIVDGRFGALDDVDDILLLADRLDHSVGIGQRTGRALDGQQHEAFARAGGILLGSGQGRLLVPQLGNRQRLHLGLGTGLHLAAIVALHRLHIVAVLARLNALKRHGQIGGNSHFLLAVEHHIVLRRGTVRPRDGHNAFGVLALHGTLNYRGSLPLEGIHAPGYSIRNGFAFRLRSRVIRLHIIGMFSQHNLSQLNIDLSRRRGDGRNKFIIFTRIFSQ